MISKKIQNQSKISDCHIAAHEQTQQNRVCYIRFFGEFLASRRSSFSTCFKNIIKSEHRYKNGVSVNELGFNVPLPLKSYEDGTSV